MLLLLSLWSCVRVPLPLERGTGYFYSRPVHPPQLSSCCPVSNALLLPAGLLEAHEATPHSLQPSREVSLTAAELAQFQRQGFLVIPALCSPAEQREMMQILRGLFERRAGHREGQQFDMLGLDRADQAPTQPQIVKPGLYAPALLQTQYFQAVEHIARELLGRDAALSFDHSILKPAGSAAATPWHQDEAYHSDPHFHHEQVSFWLPFQDVSVENGCMQYLPGSHAGALFPHRAFGNDLRVHSIECPHECFDKTLGEPQPASAGTCILHAGRTLHSAMPNVSGGDRLVYVLVFRGPMLPRREPVVFPWLQTRQHASWQRGRQWLRQGGFAVLLGRSVRRALRADIREVPKQLHRVLHRLRASLRSWRRDH